MDMITLEMDVFGDYAALYDFQEPVLTERQPICALTMSGPHWYVQDDIYHTIFF